VSEVKQPLKSEVRFMLLLEFTLANGLKAVLYAVVRGVKGFEDLGLRFGDLGSVTEWLRSNPRFREVRFWVNLSGRDCRDLPELISERLLPSTEGVLINSCLFMRRLVSELVKLITSASSLTQ